ncbi:MAG: hypothetical protein QM235_02440 [Pseudomonadota bacterium]|nr:hypothetical protein [Pseudomonadota bacterium]
MSQKKPEKPEKERIRRFGEAKDSRIRGFGESKDSRSQGFKGSSGSLGIFF